METIVAGQVTESYVIGGEPAGVMSRVFYYGLAWELVPVFIFLGLGALQDFGPLIANPKTLLLGAGAQFGVYFAFFVALILGSAFPTFEPAAKARARVWGWLPAAFARRYPLISAACSSSSDASSP